MFHLVKAFPIKISIKQSYWVYLDVLVDLCQFYCHIRWYLCVLTLWSIATSLSFAGLFCIVLH